MPERINPLFIADPSMMSAVPANSLGPTPADAYQFNAQAAADWMEKQRAVSSERGLWNDQTGMPTMAGARDAAGQLASGLLMGTTAPGFRAYHGSPHSFDRFDTSKIGTGEGAQAYGHGLYFAENEGVARNYRDALAASHNRTPVTIPSPFGPVSILEQDAARPGSMYEVQINANPEHFLDWDKPLSEQSQAVRDRLSFLMQTHQVPRNNNVGAETTGGQLYNHLYDRFKGDQAAVAEELHGEGIPGIRYLDGGSRGAGEGTSNHVVFDPATIEILRKYGIAGLMAGGAAAAGSQGSPQQ